MPSFFTALAGFIFLHLTTHPGTRIRKRLPRLQVWRLEIFPCIRFHGRRRTLHIHHWIYFPLILAISIPLENRLLDSSITRGFLLGGAAQGLLINKKARRLIYPNPLEQSDEYR